MRTHRRTLFLAAIATCFSAALLRADDSVGSDQKLDKNGKPVGKGWVSPITADLSGWKYEPEYWKVENGVLVGYTPGTPDHHYAYTTREYGDFELHADVKLVGYNSGVCIRCKPTSFDDMPGYQVDMGVGYWGCLWDERGRGMVAKYDPADADKLVKKNEWNHYYVRAAGPHVQMWLNGVKTVDIVDNEGFAKKPTGSIGFQLAHGVGNKTEASFKNVYLRPLRSR